MSLAIPGIEVVVRDPGLPISPPSINSPLMVGTSEKGTVNLLYSFSSPADVVDTLGQGPLPEALCTYLSHPGAGAPVYAVKLAAGSGSTFPGVAGTVTKVGGEDSGTITVAGIPYDAYEVQVEITKTGDGAAGEFAYTLDGGYTWSAAIQIPTGLTYSIPSTNLTLTFVVGDDAFTDGDTHTFLCRAPYWSSSTLTPGIAAALAGGVKFAFIVGVGEASSAAIGVTQNAALAGHAETMFDSFRYVRSLANAGDPTEDKALATTSYSPPAGGGLASKRIGVAFGHYWAKTAKPIIGWGYPKRPNADIVAARAGSVLISTNLARVAEGALPGVLKITHDEGVTIQMDALRFITLRTHLGEPGFYITRGRLMAPAGSDYQYWHIGRVMDVACATAAKAELPNVGASVRLRTDGTGRIDPRDAARRERPVNASLASALTEPDNAEGTKGHVTSVAYLVDQTNNVATSDQTLGSVQMVPLGYSEKIKVTLGFTLGGAA